MRFFKNIKYPRNKRIVDVVTFIFFLFAYGKIESSIKGLFVACLFALDVQVVYYINVFGLIPKYFEKERKNYVRYNAILISILVIVISVIDIIVPRVFNFETSEDSIKHIIVPFFIHSMLCIATVIFLINQNLIEKEKEKEILISRLEREKADAQLKMLKMQINPHFLFNALNSIYVLVYEGKKDTADKIIMLSDMLRFVLHECQTPIIKLSSEVEFVRNFIHFQELRSNEKRDIQLHVNIANEDFMIVPMILNPFIENSFKHSRIHTDGGFVHINMRQEKDKLYFSVKNSIFNKNGAYWSKDMDSIGIGNVKERLQMQYGDNYQLNIEEKEESFLVELILKEINNE